MSNQVSSFIITLEKDVHENEARALAEAFSCMRGVLSVKEHVTQIEDHVAEERARGDLGRKVLAAVQELVYPNRGRGLGRPG